MKLKLNLKRETNRSYSIDVGQNKLISLRNYILKTLKPDFFVIITDTNVGKIYKAKLKKVFLSDKKSSVFLIQIPVGEKSKSQTIRDQLERKIIQLNPSKQTVVIAFGGGVVGDITGFLASTILRGIKYIQVPTTVIAQVDSAIGGKTGINLPEAKNLIGTIYQPNYVLIDTDLLQTLSEEEYLNGISEIVKSFIIGDRDAFNFLEKNYYKLLKRDKKVLGYCIERALKVKLKIVEKDEFENGLRKILNFGHTIGHAFEAQSNYKIKHGFAIAAGMIIESKIAYKIGLLSRSELIRIIELIGRLKLLPGFDEIYSFNSIYKKILFDKKKIEGGIGFSLPTKIGKCRYNVLVRKKIIKSVYPN